MKLIDFDIDLCNIDEILQSCFYNTIGKRYNKQLTRINNIGSFEPEKLLGLYPTVICEYYPIIISLNSKCDCCDKNIYTIKRDNKEIRYYNNISSVIFDDLINIIIKDFSNIFIAGGYISFKVKEYINNKRINFNGDIDIFIYGLNESQTKYKVYDIIHNLGNLNTNCKLNYSYNCVTFYILRNKTYKIQVITRSFESKEQILNSFDMGSCSVGYDGKDILVNEKGYITFKYNINIFDKNNNYPTYENRLNKYMQRGFALCFPQLDYDEMVKQINLYNYLVINDKLIFSVMSNIEIYNVFIITNNFKYNFNKISLNEHEQMITENKPIFNMYKYITDEHIEEIYSYATQNVLKKTCSIMYNQYFLSISKTNYYYKVYRHYGHFNLNNIPISIFLNSYYFRKVLKNSIQKQIFSDKRLVSSITKGLVHNILLYSMFILDKEISLNDFRQIEKDIIINIELMIKDYDVNEIINIIILTLEDKKIERLEKYILKLDEKIEISIIISNLEYSKRIKKVFNYFNLDNIKKIYNFIFRDISFVTEVLKNIFSISFLSSYEILHALRSLEKYLFIHILNDCRYTDQFINRLKFKVQRWSKSSYEKSFTSRMYNKSLERQFSYLEDKCFNNSSKLRTLKDISFTNLLENYNYKQITVLLDQL